MSDRLYVATRKGLFTVDRTTAGWQVARTAFLGDPLSIVYPDGDRLYAVLDLGHFGTKLRLSRDGGESWDELAAPEYPPKPEGLDDRDGNGRPIEWKLEKVWALARGEGPDVLWCGTLPGGLFRSEDGGKSWQLNRPLWDHPDRKKWFGGGYDWPGIHSICVDPRDAQRVHVGVSCGGVWLSEDAGASWSTRCQGMRADFMPPERQEDPAIQDPHRLVQCGSNPDALWVQHHCGIYRSTDGGSSWQEFRGVAPSSFGFAVAVHPADPDTAWFVPAVKDECRIPVDGRVVVTRTRNGGKSFEVLANGLPQESAYDLTYRHCLDVDASGNRLAFGTTTGGLWVSEDQGDHWHSVSAHLPPVYCVRFAG